MAQTALHAGVSDRRTFFLTSPSTSINPRKNQLPDLANKSVNVDIVPADAAAWTRTVAWRRGQLRALSFSPDLASRLAVDRRYDLHRVLELVDRGCPPALAARITAPLDADVVT